jgi:hypothetical protein
MRYSLLCLIVVPETDSAEMEIVVSSLKNSSACGAGWMSAGILKACLNLISSSLVRSFNESLVDSLVELILLERFLFDGETVKRIELF